MKQINIALIRPKINYAQKENQAAHLIEHILLSPKRIEKMGLTDEFYAKNVIEHNGGVNDYYVSEYFVVKSEAAGEVTEMIAKYQNDLFIDQEEFEEPCGSCTFLSFCGGCRNRAFKKTGKCLGSDPLCYKGVYGSK